MIAVHVKQKQSLEQCLNLDTIILKTIITSPSYFTISFSSKRQEVDLRSMVWQAGCRFKASKNQMKASTSAIPKISMVQHMPLQDWKSLMVYCVLFFYLDVKNIKCLRKTSSLQRVWVCQNANANYGYEKWPRDFRILTFLSAFLLCHPLEEIQF